MEDLLEKNLTVILFQNDYVKISHNQAISMLAIKWLRQITFEERITGYQLAFNLVKELAIKNLLIDNEKIFLFTKQERNWLSATFNNWVKDTVVKKFALVTSDLYKNLTDLSEFVEDTKNKFSLLNNVEHEFFTDYETAMYWFSEAA